MEWFFGSIFRYSYWLAQSPLLWKEAREFYYYLFSIKKIILSMLEQAVVPISCL